MGRALAWRAFSPLQLASRHSNVYELRRCRAISGQCDRYRRAGYEMAELAHFGLEALQRVVRDIIPNGALVSQRLNDVPEIALYLIDESYPQYALDDDAIQRIMTQPLYWVF